MGGVGTGASFQNNVRALASYKLNLRVLHRHGEPDTGLSLFGTRLETPVLVAAVAGAAINLGGSLTEEELVLAMVGGARAAGSLALTGDGPDPALFEAGLAAARQFPGTVIPVVKPRAVEEILERFAQARAAGALAAAVDVDAAALVNMTRAGQPVGPLSPAAVQRLVEGSELPVILKGIMTPDEAVLAAEAGVAGIVVSNHGGRALDHTPGTAEVLGVIARRLRGLSPRPVILVDGGFRRGEDVLKGLALGADAVMVGRPAVRGAVGGGAEGVRLVLDELTRGLRTAMILTGCPDLASVGPEVLFRREEAT